MPKETVRYPDHVVESIDELVEDGPFESKSEFYRFSAELVLDLMDASYDPQTLDFDDIVSELGLESVRVTDDGAVPVDADFVDAAVYVRKCGLRGEFEAAQEFLDAQFDDTDPLALFLEEHLAMCRRQYRTD